MLAAVAAVLMSALLGRPLLVVEQEQTLAQLGQQGQQILVVVVAVVGATR